MVNTSIVFDPSVDNRKLDREVGKIDKKLEQTGQITPDIDSSQLDGMTPDGVRGINGGGDGSGALEVAGMGALASKIPKPIAGVAASAVLPIGIAGAVGAGMLSAMQSSSARLQTSTTLLGQAWDNVWRPLGDRLDELFIRDTAIGILRATEDFEDAIRSGNLLAGAFIIDREILDFSRFISPLGWSDFISDVAWSAFVNHVNWNEWISGLSWPDWVDGLSWESFVNVLSWSPFVPNLQWGRWITRVNWGEWIRGVNLRDFVFGDNNNDTTTDPDDFTFVDDEPRFPESEFDPTDFEFTAGDATRESQLQFESGLFPSAQSGGRITRSGIAEVHRGELVADPDRLVSELASAINTNTGGGGGMDTGGIESKLDRLHRDLTRLMDVMNQSIEVDGETLGRVVSNSQQNAISGSNPLV